MQSPWKNIGMPWRGPRICRNVFSNKLSWNTSEYCSWSCSIEVKSIMWMITRLSVIIKIMSRDYSRDESLLPITVEDDHEAPVGADQSEHPKTVTPQHSMTSCLASVNCSSISIPCSRKLFRSPTKMVDPISEKSDDTLFLIQVEKIRTVLRWD